MNIWFGTKINSKNLSCNCPVYRIIWGKTLLEKLKKTISRQSSNCSTTKLNQFTGIYLSTLIHPLLSETGLIFAQILLKNCQRIYAYWLFTLLDKNLTKTFLLISLKNRDKNSWFEDEPINSFL